MISFFFVFVRFIRAFGRAIRDPEFQVLSFVVLILLLTGTLFYHNIEGWKWLDALYFSVITLTTVGYGDLSPQTDLGKIFTMVYILVGLGVLLGFISVIAEYSLKKNGNTTSDKDRSV